MQAQRFKSMKLQDRLRSNVLLKMTITKHGGISTVGEAGKGSQQKMV